MSEVTAPTSAPLVVLSGDIAAVEQQMLMHEQVECPVVHRFGPGVYIREVSMQAGTFAVGHGQREAHTNLMLRGRVRMLNADGTFTELVGPLFFIGQPGRKMGFIVEDVVWQNVYATDERDIAKLEARFLDKSPGWQVSEAQRQGIAREAHQPDRDDFELILQQTGFPAALVRAQSEFEGDQIPMPAGSYTVKVGESAIEGRGLRATAAIPAGAVIAPARVGGKRTPAGRFTNHSTAPNARMVARPGGDIDLVALRDIAGCRGGQDGEEITVCYRQALRLSGIHITKD